MNQGSTTRSQPKKNWLLPTAVIAIAVLLIGTVLFMNQRGASIEEAAAQAPTTATVEQAEAAEPDLTDLEARDSADPLALGTVDASIGLIVFSDYQCPFCAKWSNDTLPLLMSHVDAGDLRIEWRDVNIFGEPSVLAAQAAYAAGLQDAFMDYHHLLFDNGEIREEDQLSDEALYSLASELGLDSSKFIADFNSPETLEAIAANSQLGIDLGAYSTPSFLLDGQPIVGAQPSEVFLDAIDTALAQEG